MRDTPTLSICIPTYNRSRLLAELLDSIVAQDMPEIEVVVSDDASPDDTAVVATRYAARFPKFTFIRQPANIGVDRNFLAVVGAATGDYVWLMGDDDRLESGGAGCVFDALRRWPDVLGLTLGVIDYDHMMAHAVGVRAMPASQRMAGVGQVFGELADLLGFMSALVVRRDAWIAKADDDLVRGFENYYVQVYLVGRMIGRDGGWGVVREPCVGFRTSNDQFLAKLGWLERLRIDVVAYRQIADALLKDDAPAWTKMQRRIFETHVMARVYNAKTTAGRTPNVTAAALFLFGQFRGMRGYWTKALPALLAPKWAIRTARAGYRRFARTSGSARARMLGDGRG